MIAKLAHIMALLLTMSLLAVAVAMEETVDDSSARWTPPVIEVTAYQDVIDRNIFLADRHRVIAVVTPTEESLGESSEVSEQASISESLHNPDANLVLVGTALREGIWTAFIEDRQAGVAQRVDQTGPFSQGEITQIDFDGITYSVANKARQIGLQQTLAGTQSVAAPSASNGQESAAQPEAVSEIFRRMRERRAQESSSSQTSE